MSMNQQSERSSTSTTGRSSAFSLGNYVFKRRSKNADIVTGASSGFNTREQVAMVRPPHERKAMGKLARRRIESHDGRWLTRSCWAALHGCAHFCMGSSDDNHGKENEEEGGESPQFTLKSKRRVVSFQFLCCHSVFCIRSISTLTNNNNAQ